MKATGARAMAAKKKLPRAIALRPPHRHHPSGTNARAMIARRADRYATPGRPPRRLPCRRKMSAVRKAHAETSTVVLLRPPRRLTRGKANVSADSTRRVAKNPTTPRPLSGHKEIGRARSPDPRRHRCLYRSMPKPTALQPQPARATGVTRWRLNWQSLSISRLARRHWRAS